MASKRIYLTYGVLPTEEQFDQAWDETFAESLKNTFGFRNDPRVGNAELTQSELWKELQQATKENNEDGNEEAGSWASGVLGHLDVEWV